MQALIHLPSKLSGTVRVPASKSICNRVLILSALADGLEGIRRLDNLSDCDDTQAMRRALTSTDKRADIGAAGTAMRFLTALFAATPGEHILTGSARMQQRPVGVLVDALRQLGASVAYEGREGFPPLHLSGRELQGGDVRLSASVSSQYISALLMVGPTMAKGLRLHLEGDIISRPYIDMTLGLMNAFGAEAGWEDAHTLLVRHGGYHYDGRFAIESDWSGASYWYEAVALSPDAGARIRIPGLQHHSLQGDAAVRHYFKPLGVDTTFTDSGVVLTKARREKAIAATDGTVNATGKTVTPTASPVRLDLSRQPDLAQTLAVTCAMLERPFRLEGLRTLRIKETDRIAALQNELAKLGYRVEAEGDDALTWTGQRCPPQLSSGIATYDDHRMALAFAPCAFRFPGLRIQSPTVVTKSYPGYWDEWKSLGARIDTQENN